MGVHKNISYEKFPVQGAHLGAKVKVCFNYDTKQTIMGIVVRDDKEEPFRTIIRLEDGRYVEANECQYAIYR